MKSQSSKIKRPEGVALILDENRAQREEGRLLLFPGKKSANEKTWILCLLEPSQLPLYLCKKAILPFPCENFHMTPCAKVLITVADPKLQFSADPE